MTLKRVLRAGPAGTLWFYVHLFLSCPYAPYLCKVVCYASINVCYKTTQLLNLNVWVIILLDLFCLMVLSYHIIMSISVIWLSHFYFYCYTFNFVLFQIFICLILTSYIYIFWLLVLLFILDTNKHRK